MLGFRGRGRGFGGDAPFAPEFGRQLGLAGHVRGDGGGFVRPIDPLGGLEVRTAQYAEVGHHGLAYLGLPVQLSLIHI